VRQQTAQECPKPLRGFWDTLPDQSRALPDARSAVRRRATGEQTRIVGIKCPPTTPPDFVECGICTAADTFIAESARYYAALQKAHVRISWLWRQECPDSSAEAFIFPDAKGGFVDTGNYRRRVLHRLARDLELPKLTFQVIRRTIATLAQKKKQ
jgi:hypothetical protein